MAVRHCLDTNVLLYAFSSSPRDAAKSRVAREWILGQLRQGVHVIFANEDEAGALFLSGQVAPLALLPVARRLQAD